MDSRQKDNLTDVAEDLSRLQDSSQDNQPQQSGGDEQQVSSSDGDSITLGN